MERRFLRDEFLHNEFPFCFRMFFHGMFSGNSGARDLLLRHGTAWFRNDFGGRNISWLHFLLLFLRERHGAFYGATLASAFSEGARWNVLWDYTCFCFSEGARCFALRQVLYIGISIPARGGIACACALLYDTSSRT